MPFDVLIHNTGFFSKKAALDLCVDESSFGYGGFGEGVTTLRGKKVNRGLQSVILADVGTNMIRGIVHRHRKNVKPEGFTQPGPSEIRTLLENYVEGNVGEVKLWDCKPHITADNYFYDEKIRDWIGTNGYGWTSTMAKNELLKEIPKHHFHHLDTSSKFCILFS